MDVSKIELIAHQEIWITLLILFPLLAITTAVAVIVGALQAMTQINEQTLSFSPKLIVVLLLVIFLGGAMFDLLVNLTVDVIKQAPSIF